MDGCKIYIIKSKVIANGLQPEVIDSVGMAGYSAKCDIWSLGCVLLEMLTAERPWPKMTMVQIVMEVSNNNPWPETILIIYTGRSKTFCTTSERRYRNESRCNCI